MPGSALAREMGVQRQASTDLFTIAKRHLDPEKFPLIAVAHEEH
jgi:hypothetical protein